MITPSKKEKESKGTLTFLRRQQEESRAKELAQKYNLPYINLITSPIDLDALALIPEGKARVGLFVSFQRKGERIAVAALDPKDNLVLETLENFKKRDFKQR